MTPVVDFVLDSSANCSSKLTTGANRFQLDKQ